MNLKTNRVYQHKSGSLYTLLAVSNLKATKDGWKQQAVYVDENGVVWTRPVKEFEEKMTLSEENISFVILPLLEFKKSEKDDNSTKSSDNTIQKTVDVTKYPENGF